MNKKLREQLKSAFDAPEPERKKEFLLSVNFPRMNWLGFILSQIGYIRKRVWVISCIIAVFALLGLHLYTGENNLQFVWIVSSVLPFISLMTITEISRSASYNMAELEMGCRYNFSHIVLARLGILSCFNAAIFVLIAVSFVGETGFNIFRLVVYSFMPFLMTCSLSLFALNHVRSKENMYICGGIACFVSGANTFVSMQYKNVFANENLLFWIIAFAVLLIIASRETIKLIKKTEEFQLYGTNY